MILFGYQDSALIDENFSMNGEIEHQLCINVIESLNKIFRPSFSNKLSGNLSEYLRKRAI